MGRQAARASGANQAPSAGTPAGVMLGVRAVSSMEPALLQVEDIPVPGIDGPDQVLIEVRAAAVNRSDALACRGLLPGPFPRVLGRAFAGVVVAGTRELLGRSVWGAGGEIGLSCDGAYAQYLASSRTAVTPMPAGLSFAEAAASALSYLTAAAALRLAGPVGRESTVIVTGAVGGVGAAAADVARRLGARRVIGVVKGADELSLAVAAGIDRVIDADLSLGDRLVDAAGPTGATSAVDVVGGPLTADITRAMGARGKICLLSSPPQDSVAAIDLLDFYRKELHLLGLHTGRLTPASAAARLRELAPGFGDGSLRPTPVYATYSLGEVAQAFAAAERGVRGRPVLLPHGPTGADTVGTGTK